MRRSMLPWFGMLLLAGYVAEAGAASRASVPDWATDFLHRWYAAFNQGDAPGVAALFTADASFATLEGRAAIEKGFAADFAQASYRCDGEFDGLRELGTLAVAWGHESCLETPHGVVAGRHTRERWLLVLEREADGHWRLSRETYEPVAQAGRE